MKNTRMHQTKISHASKSHHVTSNNYQQETYDKKSTNNATLNYKQTLHMKIPILRNPTKILPKSYTPVIITGI